MGRPRVGTYARLDQLAYLDTGAAHSVPIRRSAARAAINAEDAFARSATGRLVWMSVRGSITMTLLE
jgi:hypothetical protein